MSNPGERVHVYPERDLAEHVLSDTCWCQPKLLPEGPGFVVMHNALDGRKSQNATDRPDS